MSEITILQEENEINVRIPKVIHYCWFGGSPYPDLVKRCMETWKRVLPDYQMKLWSEHNFDFHQNPFTHKAYLEKKWAFVADYVRLYALYNEGGIYLDTDVEVLKSLDGFLIHSAFTGFERKHHLTSGIIGAEKGHPWIKEILDHYTNSQFLLHGPDKTIPIPFKITEISNRYGFQPGDLEQELSCGVHIYPVEYFCPMDPKHKVAVVTDNTHTIHHFIGSWVPRIQKIESNVTRWLRNLIGRQQYYAIKKRLFKAK